MKSWFSNVIFSLIPIEVAVLCYIFFSALQHNTQTNVILLCTLSKTPTLLQEAKQVWGDGNPNLYFTDKSGMTHRYVRSQFESCVTLSPDDFKERNI